MHPADLLLRLARWIAPAGRAGWLKAMEAEYLALETGHLRWALGCAGVSLGWRLAKDGLYAALICAAIWFLCSPPTFLFLAEIKLIPKTYMNLGLYPHPFYIALICLLLGIYRPGLIALTALVVVVSVTFDGFYMLYIALPKRFDFEQEPLWEFLQHWNIYDAKLIIGIWSELGACLTGGLIGRAIAYRMRPASKAGNASGR